MSFPFCFCHFKIITFVPFLFSIEKFSHFSYNLILFSSFVMPPFSYTLKKGNLHLNVYNMMREENNNGKWCPTMFIHISMYHSIIPIVLNYFFTCLHSHLT